MVRAKYSCRRSIVDFYCPQHRLVVKLDGAVHDQQGEYDAARTEKLNHLGYRVIRFDNRDVMSDLSRVLQQIVNAIEPQPPLLKVPQNGGSRGLKPTQPK